MAAEIRSAVSDVKVTLIPGGRGDFVVIADGRELWNKRQAGRFPETTEILANLVSE